MKERRHFARWSRSSLRCNPSMNWRNGSRVWSNYPPSKNSQKNNNFTYLNSLQMRESTSPSKGTKFLSNSRKLHHSQMKTIFSYTSATSIGTTSGTRPKIPTNSITLKKKEPTCMPNPEGGSQKWHRAAISTKITQYARRKNQSRNFRNRSPNSQKKDYSTSKTQTNVSTPSEKSSSTPFLQCSSTAKPFKNKPESISNIGPPFNCPPSRINTVNMSKIVIKTHVASFRARTSVLSWNPRTRDAAAKENISRGSTYLTV